LVFSARSALFFNNLASPDGSIEHTGDNLTGEGAGETIKINLGAVPGEVTQTYPTTSWKFDARWPRTIQGSQELKPAVASASTRAPSLRSYPR